MKVGALRLNDLELSPGLTVTAVGSKLSQPIDWWLLLGEPPGRACLSFKWDT